MKVSSINRLALELGEGYGTVYGALKREFIRPEASGGFDVDKCRAWINKARGEGKLHRKRDEIPAKALIKAALKSAPTIPPELKDDKTSRDPVAIKGLTNLLGPSNKIDEKRILARASQLREAGRHQAACELAWMVLENRGLL